MNALGPESHAERDFRARLRSLSVACGAAIACAAGMSHAPERAATASRAFASGLLRFTAMLRGSIFMRRMRASAPRPSWTFRSNMFSRTGR